MQRIKISQNPETGTVDSMIEAVEPSQAAASRVTQALAATTLGLNRSDDNHLTPDSRPAQDARQPERGELLLAASGRSREVTDAEQTLKNHSLNGSFVSHFGQQFNQKKIRIGLIDDFGPNETHGRNVEQRILAQMPQELRDKVEIVRYDVAGLNADDRARMISKAASDAQDKKLLALSVSGGISAYPVANIERLIGNRDLTKDNAREAYDAVIKNNNSSTALQQAMRDLNSASGKIPVVTPVWNNDSTTLPALLLGSKSGNGIVTSIDRPAVDPGGKLYNATQIPGLVDVTVPGQFPNPNTSQSTPYFIGNLLRYGLEKYKERNTRADGGSDPVA
jgi:hypothetical protein